MGSSEASKLLEGKLEGGCRHGKTVFLEELCGEMVEKIEREISLYGQVCDRLGEAQGAEVADEDACGLQAFKRCEELLKLAAFAAHRRARRIDEDLCARFICRFDDGFDVREPPRLLRAECFAADVDGIGAALDGGSCAFDVADAHREAAMGRILACDGALRLQNVVLEARLLHGLAEEARFSRAVKADVACRRRT